MMRTLIVALSLLFSVSVAQAQLVTSKITDGVYALVGPVTQRSKENLANNATFGVIVTSEGVVLVDPGGSWKGAEQIHAAIKEITDKPVIYVINSGGQDHRWIGNSYWQAMGAKVIASEAAVEDHKDRGSLQMTALSNFLKEQLDGTDLSYADQTFEEALDITVGGVKIELRHVGQAHTPGDSFIWLPDAKIMFTGDIVYVDRILGIGEQSNAGSWIEVFDALATYKPEYIVPGHGPVTTLKRATAETYDYLVNLRQKMAVHMEADGDMIGSVNVDQSAFSFLKNFDQLAKRNAQQVFSEMEFE